MKKIYDIGTTSMLNDFFFLTRTFSVILGTTILNIFLCREYLTEILSYITVASFEIESCTVLSIHRHEFFPF